MRCHPVFRDAAPPREAALGQYALQVLGPDHLDEDFAVVVESTARLTGFMGGDWPIGLTRDENAIDLAWHFKEFELRRSFAWVVRDATSRYLGCAYVFPRFADSPSADVFVWARSGPNAETQEREIVAALSAWIDGPDWPELYCSFHTP